MLLTRVLRTAGLVLVGAGALVLLFTAFQLWGTGIFEARSQAVLRAQIDKEIPSSILRHSAHDPPTTTSTAPPKTAVPTAAPGEGQGVGFIQIPSIGLNQAIVQGVGTADLRKGPGHYPGTPLPGQPGNVAIAGHRTTYGHPFYNLNAVAVGDQVTLTTPQGIFVYATRWSKVVVPTNTSVIGPSAAAELTLTTCNPRYSASQRLVLRATLVHSVLTGAAHRGTAPAPVAGGTTVAASTGLAGAGASSDWLPVVLWGLLTAAVGVATWFAARRASHRWPFYLAGTIVLLVVLFFLFASISPLLPASF